jgi:hypothetical protein
MSSLRALIGTDCAERIQVTSRWEAWLDENGASAGKPVNQAATLLLRSFGWQFNVLGTLVIVGLDTVTGRPTGLSAEQIDVILSRTGTSAT